MLTDTSNGSDTTPLRYRVLSRANTTPRPDTANTWPTSLKIARARAMTAMAGTGTSGDVLRGRFSGAA